MFRPSEQRRSVVFDCRARQRLYEFWVIFSLAGLNYAFFCHFYFIFFSVNAFPYSSSFFFFFLRLIDDCSYTSHCSQLRAAVSNNTKSLLQLCSGHSLAMCCAVWFAAPHSHDADGDSPIWFMLDLKLP